MNCGNLIQSIQKIHILLIDRKIKILALAKYALDELTGE